MVRVRGNLRALLEPESIAVVGASERPGPGRQVLENLDAIGFPGRIIPINPKYDSVLGHRCYPSFDAVRTEGVTIDAAALLLGRDHVVSLIEDAARAGVRGAWAFASGFSESGPDGEKRQKRLAEACRSHEIAFCGPNCVGYINPVFRSAAYSAPLSPEIRPGHVGAVTQSGSICLALANSARGIGYRLLISSGNEAVVDSADYIDFLLDDAETQLVMAFIEQFRRPEAFLEAARKARDLGKPLIVLKVGRSDLAKRAVAAHTGALAGSDAVYDAIFRKYGVIRVEDLDEMLETAEAFSRLGTKLPQGPRVGMLTVSGGEISLIGDLAEGLPLTFPEWSQKTRNAMAKVLPDYADIANPLDAWGSGRVEETYAECVRAAVDEDVDLVMISQDAPPGMADSQVDQYAVIARAAADASQRSGKPIVAVSHLAGGLDPTLRALFAEGDVPLLQGTREGLRAAAHLIDHARMRRTCPLPRRVEAEKQPLASGLWDEVRSKRFLRDQGIPVVEEVLCHDVEEAVHAARRIGYPVVAKAVSSALPHKTEAGVVRLGIESDDALNDAYEEITCRAAESLGGAAPDGVLIQRMVRGAIAEVIAGIAVDPAFGPSVVFGFGGTWVELVKDRVLGIPPLTRQEAVEMISRTKVAQLLEGFRGSPAGDVPAVAEVLLRLSRIAELWRGSLMAVDINPLLVLPEGQGVVAVDGLVEWSGMEELSGRQDG